LSLAWQVGFLVSYVAKSFASESSSEVRGCHLHMLRGGNMRVILPFLNIEKQGELRKRKEEKNLQ
jgi:hypothetical protein